MVMAPIDRFPRPLPLPRPMPNEALVDQLSLRMVDGDGNNTVSEKEWHKAGWTADRFEAFDGDGDGQVTEKEFLSARRYEREFNTKDRDGDGSLSRTEINGLSFYHRIHGKVEEALGGAKKLGGDLVRHLPFPGLKDRFERYDADNDGQVSKSEYMAARRKEETLIRTLPTPLPWFGHKAEVIKADAKTEN